MVIPVIRPFSLMIGQTIRAVKKNNEKKGINRSGYSVQAFHDILSELTAIGSDSMDFK
jgi:hypothetical protein